MLKSPRPARKAEGSGLPGQVLEPAPMSGRVDFLTDLGTIEEGSPLDIELKEAGLDQNRSQLSATWKACSLSV